jgi:hypothetical protein
MPEEQVLERRKGSKHETGKVHSLGTIQEEEEAQHESAMQIEMGDVAATASTGEKTHVRARGLKVFWKLIKI